MASASLVPDSSPPSPAPLRLVEAKVFVQLDREERNAALWYLDTGATNHMSGSRGAFSELDTRVLGTVRFGDGSVINIEGRGTVLFACKTGEHRVLIGVYYIPRLNANIISIGQLDENGCQVLIDGGLLLIRDEGRRLMARVKRSPNRLYTLKMEITQSVCLSARSSEEAWRWHAMYGYLNFQALRKLAQKALVRGLPQIDQVDQICDGCLVGNAGGGILVRNIGYSEKESLRITYSID